MTAPAIGTKSGRQAGRTMTGHRARGGRLRRMLAGYGQPAWARPALLAARSHPRAASAQIFRDLKRTLGQLLRAE